MNILLALLLMTSVQFTHSVSIPDIVSNSIDSTLRADSVGASQIDLLPFGNEIDSVARVFHLPAALLAAIVQEESRFEPWATRLEPSYQNNPRVVLAAKSWSRNNRGLPTAATETSDRSRSYGLTQIMGETAREQGYSCRFLAALYQPSHSLGEGAHLLRTLLERYPHDTLSAISAYNQGDARKHLGVFVNARYVYRVAVAWRIYRKLLVRDPPTPSPAPNNR